MPDLKIIAADEGLRIRMPGGDQTLIKLAAADTGDRFSLSTFEIGPSVTTPLHVHTHEDEAFYVLDGVLDFWIGRREDGRRLIATRGMTVYLPRGVPHCYRNLSGADVRTLLVVSPAANFEAFYAKVAIRLHEDAREGESVSILKIMKHAPEHGLEILGPNPLD